MLDIRYIRDHAEEIKMNCKNRRVKVDIDVLLSLDSERRGRQKERDSLRADRRQTSKAKPHPAEIERMKQVGEKVEKIEKELEKIEKKYFELLLSINTSKGEIDKLNKTARKLRKDNWGELQSQFKGDHNAIMNHLRNI